MSILRRKKGLKAKASDAIKKAKGARSRKTSPPWGAIGAGAVALGGAAAWAGRYRLMGAVTKAMAKRKTKAAVEKPKKGAEKVSKAAS